METYSPGQLANFTASFLGRPKRLKWLEPTTICLFVTERCTLSCRWCLRNTVPQEVSRKPGDMTYEEAVAILRTFRRTTHLGLAGFGEPLINKDLFKIIRESERIPLRTSVITNGTLLKDRIDEFEKITIHRLSVSINSLNEEEHKKMCGGNESTVKSIIGGIEKIIAMKRRPHVHISFVMTRNKISKLDEIIKFAEEIGVDNLDLHNMINYDKSKANYSEMLTDDDEEINDLFYEYKLKRYKVKIGWPVLVRKGLERPARICNCFWTWLGVDRHGNTAGCSKAMTTNKIYGNIFQEGKRVWNSEFRMRSRAWFLEKKFISDLCKTCTEIQPKKFSG